MSTIHLLIGENVFSLQQEKMRWKQGFALKHGSENLSDIDATNTSFRELLDEVSVKPFLAEKRLILVRGIPSMEKEQVAILERSIHPDVLLLLIDAKPDKRLTAVKELLKIATVHEQKPVTGIELQSWIIQYCSQHGVTIDKNAILLLTEMLGEDQQLIASELDRLCLLADKKNISATVIEETVIATDEGVIWNISDYLSKADQKKALAYARRMIERGADMFGLWAIIISMAKNIGAVKAALESGLKDGKSIAESTGIHPFAVRNIVIHAKRISMNELHEYIQWIAAKDAELKTGSIRSTDESPEELRSLIDRAIMHCPV